MAAWKWFSLIASGLILLGGIVTIVQLGRLIWQEKNADNLRRFRHLVIRFFVLVLLTIILMAVGRWVQYSYWMGTL